MNASILLILTLVAAEPAPAASDSTAKPAPSAGTVTPAAAADTAAAIPAPSAATTDGKASAPSSAAAPADASGSGSASTSAPAEAAAVPPPPPTEPVAPVAPVPEPAPAAASQPPAAPPPAAPAATATTEPAPGPAAAPAAEPPGALPAATGAPLAAPAAGAAGEPPPDEKKDRLPRLGLAYEVGFPQGMTAGLVVRPWGWLRVMGGVNTYGSGVGFHGEVSLAPLRWYITLPILSISAGRIGGIDLGKAGVPSDLSGLVSATQVQYASVMTGFELGNQRHGMLSIQVGVTRMEMDAPGTASFATDPVTAGGTAASVEIEGATVKTLFAAFKVGWTIFL